MTPEQLEEIEARAKAATPGPWSVDPDNREGYEWNNHIVSPTGRVCFMSHSPDDNAPLKAAAHHIAGMDPATTLALTAALRQAWEENERLKNNVEWAVDTLREINVNNYDHDDVCQLNDASVEVILGLAALLRALAYKDQTND